MKTLPSAPVSTAMFPPDPSRMLTSRRTLCSLIGALAASSRIKSTMLRALAKAWEGVNQPPAATKPAVTVQQRQKSRRDSVCWLDTNIQPHLVDRDGHRPGRHIISFGRSVGSAQTLKQVPVLSVNRTAMFSGVAER